MGDYLKSQGKDKNNVHFKTLKVVLKKVICRKVIKNTLIEIQKSLMHINNTDRKLLNNLKKPSLDVAWFCSGDVV